ncbi:MAG: flap endonuclease-1 [Candidatus Aenigmarchaeota archaeon]|nr:flap endonuclease-1 [Candidatus Aenigmarchaeota archaeon]
MGVKISKVIPKKEIRMEDLSGKVLAVDGFNILYQFLTTIKDRETGEPFTNSKGNVTSHLSGLFYRSINMLHAGIKLVFVFDGERPDLKMDTVNHRAEKKKEAKIKLEEALAAGDREAVLRHSGATMRLTDKMLDDAKRLLEVMGIPWIQAPSEGEAQAAHMAAKGDAYAVMSQDADTLLFGTPRLVQNLSVTGRRKMPGRNMWIDVSPQMVELDKVLAELDITREQLIIMSMLIGTDYNPQGIRGLGPAKALKLVREEKTLDAVLEKVDWTFECDPYVVFELFTKPAVTDDYKIEFGQPDPEKIRKVLIEEFEFSSERIANSLKKLDEIKRRNQQKSLFAWK